MERLWTRSFILMILGTFFLFTAFYMLYPTLPLFIKHIGGNETHVGLSMGIFMLSAVILRPVIGGLLDWFGRRPFIILGLSLFTLAMYMYNWVNGITALIWLRMLHGVSWAISTTAILTVIADIVPTTRYGEGMGWFGTAMTLAMAIGPMLGMWVVQNLSYHALFLFAVALSITALLLKFGVKMLFQPQSDAKRIEFFEKPVLSVAVSVLFLFISYASITTFVPLFADLLKVNSGLFFLVYSATLFLSRPIAGKLSDQYGEMFVVVPALLISILALIVLSVSTGLFGMLVSAVLYGIGFGSAQPVLQATIVRLVPPDRRGVANASFSTATDLGIGLGAIILGWISKYTSYQILFTISAVSVIFSLLVFVFFVKHLLKSKGLR
ncbi:major facilitator superfamily MFS_1 [Thermoanaerobacter italicus Ab9]|uniref:Major facilitator superfamily MFS_1 n=1 Tax=Thermoanaerobacter italicus (strain DSM 9252 / Ab9) TaxID=580331 RepID=D3T7A1_THEIA|nr:MFS transporter [Thermoanaerobacter italicus]ADD01833.1 major facilitator superfamily MFS_1 [Thermoanaerobacter italicus Ab9]